jgi:pyruvate/2-oxoglutarate dehydrogenase complex dihydrolipoamide acyltransferase (E2) component
MTGEIRIPASGELGTEIMLVAWRKNRGDTVKRGEIVAEIEADKGLLEIEAVETGVLGEVLKGEGESCTSGEVIGTILGEGGETSKPAAPVKAVPAARRLAAERGLSLENIDGTGPDGIVTAGDVENAAANSRPDRKQAAAGAQTGPGAAPPSEQHAGGETGDIPVELSFNQRLVLGAVERSNREIPTVRFSTVIDMSRAMQEKETLGVRYDALYLHALGKVLLRHQSFLRYCTGGAGEGVSVYQRRRCNVALAVAQKDRLYTPVIRDIDRKTPEEIEEEIEDTVWDIVDGTWKNDREPGGEGCLLLSNLGMYPVSNFDALVYPGQSSALAVGQIEERTVVSGGGIHIAPLCTVTIAIDHRIVNGRDAAEFLKDLKRILETGKVKPDRQEKSS